ncbi:RXT2-like protein [Apodospora peruviana]|uniref:RXT2-like protein n=1 Tax=Apodospora peruviana TaxID=516989 RepID=A0AAE0M218_9PEZI|nr:RXT2-like protein [Apodospora peruviana]
MATQQQAIIDTIVAIRKALKRKAYDSDSDSPIEHNTNRGYKLKKRSRFVKQGRIAPSLDAAAYKEVAELAGIPRTIIHRNPPLIDDEGYELESDDNEERVQEASASAKEDDPYASIHLERLLAPLTAVTDLPTHPALSRPFTSKALTELVSQSRLLMQKENAALWKVRPLLTRLVGDNSWAPCGMMIEENDHELFTDTARFLTRQAPTSSAPQIATPNPDFNGKSRGVSALQETVAKAQTSDGRLDQEELGKGKEKEVVDGETTSDGGADKQTDAQNVNGDHAESDGNPEPTETLDKMNVDGREDVDMVEAHSGEVGEPGSLALATQSQAIAERGSDSRGMSANLELLQELFIHPLFLPPRSAHPDRDVGLPEVEAEEVRRILQHYIQKQEEVCRGTKKLYEGLLKAERYRKTVWQWSKAEAHCGPNRDMSDGEDWYDKEEWGLTEDLKKGEDEVEEDTAQTQKKTRNRR